MMTFNQWLEMMGLGGNEEDAFGKEYTKDRLPSDDDLSKANKTTSTYKEGDRIVTTITYETPDFTYVVEKVSYEPNIKDLQLNKLNGELEMAVKKEDYSLAAEIKSKIEDLKKQ